MEWVSRIFWKILNYFSTLHDSLSLEAPGFPRKRQNFTTRNAVSHGRRCLKFECTHLNINPRPHPFVASSFALGCLGLSRPFRAQKKWSYPSISLSLSLSRVLFPKPAKTVPNGFTAQDRQASPSNIFPELAAVAKQVVSGPEIPAFRCLWLPGEDAFMNKLNFLPPVARTTTTIASARRTGTGTTA